MERVFRKLCSSLCWLILFSSIGADVHAACEGLVDVLHEQQTLYADFTNMTLDFQTDQDITLESIPENKLDKNGFSLREEYEITPPEGEISRKFKLNSPLVVKADNGQKYLLRPDTEFSYTPPVVSSGYKVILPKGTVLNKQSGTSPKEDVYKLPKKTPAKLKPHGNYLVPLTLATQIEVMRIPGTGPLGTTLTIDPNRAPSGDYIILVLENLAFDFSKARFHVCLRGQAANDSQNEAEKIDAFFPSDDVELMKLENVNKKATIRARIPTIPGISGVHFAKPVDLLVVAHTEDGKMVEVVSKKFLISSHWLATFCLISAFIIPWGVACCIAKNKKKNGKSWLWGLNPIQFFSGKYGSASLSLAQILLWTILVFSASFYVLVASGKLLNLTPDILTLLGIAGGSSVLAKIAASAKDKVGREIIDLSAGGSQQKEPKWQDLIKSDGRPDIYKFQMALFTILACAFVTGKIFTTLNFPELPSGLLTLIGISNGVYLAAKGTSRTVFERLAEKHNELKEAEKEAKNRDEEITELSNKLKEAETFIKEAETEYNNIQADKNADQATKDSASKKYDEAKQKNADVAKEIVMKKTKAEDAKKVADDRVKELQDQFKKLKDEALQTPN